MKKFDITRTDANAIELTDEDLAQVQGAGLVSGLVNGGVASKAAGKKSDQGSIVQPVTDMTGLGMLVPSDDKYSAY